MHTNFEKMITSGEEEKMERGMVFQLHLLCVTGFQKKQVWNKYGKILTSV